MRYVMPSDQRLCSRHVRDTARATGIWRGCAHCTRRHLAGTLQTETEQRFPNADQDGPEVRDWKLAWVEIETCIRREDEDRDMPDWYSLSDAAEATARSRTTMRRYLDQHRFPGARRDESGAEPSDRARWLVPEVDLIALGLLQPNATPEPAAAPVLGEADLNSRLAVAEALADERAETVRRLREECDRLLEIIAIQARMGGAK